MSDLKINGTSECPKDGPLAQSLKDQDQTVEPKKYTGPSKGTTAGR